ncbi:MAG: RagB/SusD family nutrient uptake outer membrane protein [Marinifilaceae bacterium]
MKSKITLLLLVTILVIQYGCDAYLDVKPKDKYTQDQLLSTKGGFYTALNGIYSNLALSSLYGENLSYKFIDILGKRYAAVTSSDYITSLNAYAYGDKDVANTLRGIWAKSYNTILNANVLLESVKAQEGILTVKEAQRMEGELLAIRAFLHLDMLRLFGPVYSRNADKLAIPYNDVSTIRNLPLLSADTILNYKIIPDLESAEKLLKDTDPVVSHGVMGPDDSDEVNDSFRQLRLNYYAVKALKARALLYGGDKENALLAANDVIEDNNVKTFFPFVDPNKLLANNINPDRVFSTESFFGIYNKYRNNIYTYTFSPDNVGNNLLQPKVDFITALFSGESQDYRLQSQWSKSSSAGVTGDIFVKFQGIKDDKNELFYGTYMPLIRLSEMYYIAAECETDLAERTRRLNEIREKRGVPALTFSKESDFLTALRKEYLKEFVGEGQIFYLYKRLYVNILKTENGYDGTDVKVSDAVLVPPLPQSELENR